MRNFDVIVVGSEGEKSKAIADTYKFEYVEAKNNPLSDKMNKGIQACKDYDGVIVIGSDNFVTPSIFKQYHEIDCTKPEFYSINDIHLYSVHGKRLVTGLKEHFEKSDNPSGVARLYTKAALELVNYKPWNESRNSGLDLCAQHTLEIAGAEHKTLDYKGHFILDVKQQENITTPEYVDNFTEVDIKEIEVLGKKTASDILDLKPGKKILKREDPPKNHFDKVGVEITEAFHQFKVGEKVLLPRSTARGLVKTGKAKYKK